mmetsp:Transcript_5227/g.7992  ORF Transcript_5227/g.7992 Transcript_5227/m.7992 type:complete len:580 (+) Transcript_5227:427-2166(+)|eukprot:CAMPEP_0203785916 /NCGR_PEP_ID=MMETSP0100_2-20121128/1303_1 /ASSEMBLY_ACC=CAM_ASM_000210 /TAXON_ID=96639 /ORGANISM=" , Strain NY0313808BC1" /LENGTH=579 /DNA_ID=CAMNT_0050688093 /DNA_START=407 /DNA_END=2146 /DNA_ORIENTATION=-
MENNSLKNWRRAVDNQTGRVYFYNKVTRETQWDAPEGGEEIFMRGWYSSLTLQDDDMVGMNEDEHDVIREDEDFRDIREAFDEKTGKRYFYDRKTRRTYWEDPRTRLKVSAEKWGLRGNDSELLSEAEQAQGSSSFDGSDIHEEFEDVYEQEDDNFLESFLKAENCAHEESVCSESMVTGDIEQVPSLDVVRSSLVLLKRRIAKNGASHRETIAAVPPIPPPTKHAAINDVCLRMTNCSCSSCTQGIPAAASVSNPRSKCRSCGRSFCVDSLAKHEGVCDKVFSAKKQPKRIHTVTLAQQKKSKGTNWRAKSMQLRRAMMSERQGGVPTNTFSSTLSTTASSGDNVDTFNNGMVPCPHCKRTFNEKAAERHIPKCNDIKAKPKLLLRGTGKGAYKSQKARSRSPPIHNGTVDSFKSDTVASNTGSSNGSRSRRRTLSPNSNRLSVTENGVLLRECPHCARHFGKKAFDRHLEYCAKVKKQAGWQKQIEKRNVKKKGYSELMMPNSLTSADEEEFNLQRLENYLHDDQAIAFESYMKCRTEESLILNENNTLYLNASFEQDSDRGPYEYIQSRDSLYNGP